jgi:hypothetical protein
MEEDHDSRKTLPSSGKKARDIIAVLPGKRTNKKTLMKVDHLQPS